MIKRIKEVLLYLYKKLHLDLDPTPISSKFVELSKTEEGRRYIKELLSKYNIGYDKY